MLRRSEVIFLKRFILFMHMFVFVCMFVFIRRSEEDMGSLGAAVQD